MPQRVFVTGAGIISAIGDDYGACWKALRQNRSGIGPIKLLKTRHADALPAGEVKHTNRQLQQMAGALDRSNGYSRTALLSLIAARAACVRAEISDNSGRRTGFISANTVGGMDRTEQFFKTYMQNDQGGDIRAITTHDCGMATQLVAEQLGISGYQATISTACSSSANAIMLGARLIKHNVLDRVVAGGADALTQFTLNGFNALLILDQSPCRPFDANRKGLNLGEGAGYVVLESEKAVKASGKTPWCALTGYGNANDAYHQTASSPAGHGALLAMRQALEVAELQPEEIGYINAHGTGTANNDHSEGLAIGQLFGAQMPLVSSTKAFTGHTLGAAGGVEAVFATMALKHQTVFANLNFSTPMQELAFVPVTAVREKVDIRHVLSNSFGFGGNNTSLIFSKC